MVDEEIEEDGQIVVCGKGIISLNLKGSIPASLLNMSAANSFYKYYDMMMTILQGGKQWVSKKIHAYDMNENY